MFEKLRPQLKGNMVIHELPLPFYNACMKYVGNVYSPTLIIFERCLYELVANFTLSNRYYEYDTLGVDDILDKALKRLHTAIYYEHHLFKLTGAVGIEHDGKAKIIVENGAVLEYDTLLHEFDEDFCREMLRNLWGYEIVDWTYESVAVLKELEEL